MITFVSIAIKNKPLATLVDLFDTPKLGTIYAQVATQDTYAVVRDGLGHNGSRTRGVHRVVMGVERGSDLEVDHLDGNTLDNRKRNLEVVTRSENQKRAWRKRRGIAA